MSEVMKQPAVLNTPEMGLKGSTFFSFLPAALAVAGAVALTLLRIRMGGDAFISDGALMMLALACYMTAAVFHLTNLYAPSNLFQRLGLWCATAGVFFNLASWGVRWVAAHDRELAIISRQGGEMPWLWRYVPFANLYDLSLAFAFGAGITTLLIAHRKSFRFLGAITLPLAAMILVLARFIGGELINLPPVLDSYWRPIHVGIASLSYGIALVCFAVAVIYLLKDGVKTEAMGIWSSIFGLAIIASISRFSIFSPGTFGTYTASTFLPTASGGRFPLPLRADIPYAGWLLVLTGLLLVGVIFAFGRYVARHDEAARKWGHRLLKGALVAQALSIVVMVSQVKTLTDVALCDGARPAGVACLDKRQYPKFGEFLAKQRGARPEQIAQMSPAQLVGDADEFVKARSGEMFLSLNANPVELSALITALVATLFVIIFSFRTEKLREALPPLEKIDSLMYKTAGVTFAGLALLLMTGAIWANESWGRYWGWDSKETGAFVAWLTYAGFLHTRISRGWTGRASAYFAIVAFLLVIFTYLGVSYLLPGLHSYA
ncbi:MAG TPA: cytochrome c biogenesis protein CcsA [Pyrinomonadaceae bacterium]|jgi:ABC-type transport system involved in cytochrome c biogenesis permease subunit|nr:cytochrome c biogenesis protein CcsA [Pyrinomonadaceae bacterium]